MGEKVSTFLTMKMGVKGDFNDKDEWVRELKLHQLQASLTFGGWL